MASWVSIQCGRLRAPGHRTAPRSIGSSRCPPIAGTAFRLALSVRPWWYRAYLGPINSRHIGEHCGKVPQESRNLQQRMTRTRMHGCKFVQFDRSQRPLWIRRVLVGPERPPAAHPNRWPSAGPKGPPSARAQEGQWLPRKREPFFVTVLVPPALSRSVPSGSRRTSTLRGSEQAVRTTSP